jgi:uncharacterized protein YuzE
MNIEYSPTINALCLRLNDGHVDQTIEVESDIYADLDAAGEPLGIEFLDAAAFFPFVARHAPMSQSVSSVEMPDGLATIVPASTRILVTWRIQKGARVVLADLAYRPATARKTPATCSYDNGISSQRPG